MTMQHISKAATAAERRVTTQDARIAAADARRIRDAVLEAYPDDDDLLAGMLEGETDVFETASKLLDAIAEADGMADAIRARVADLSARRKRMEDRASRYEAALQAILDATGLRKLELPEATVSLRRVAPKPLVNDLDALPDTLVRVKREPDLTAIRAADYHGPGVEWTNGGETISVRRT